MYEQMYELIQSNEMKLETQMNKIIDIKTVIQANHNVIVSQINTQINS